ncbi:MAG: hypothetical protein NZU63_00220 [Gemmataceae bacterium]|nr:hypothetical protein [Gemmataceae bacterium]MDW8241725.1 hypothetical protein [Thermogemmata sp.]
MGQDSRSNDHVPVGAEQVVPPWPIGWVVRLAVTGLLLNGLATGLGLVGYLTVQPGWLEGVRVLLVLTGCIAAGVALSWRAQAWWTWVLAAATALVGVVGLPASWDSYRLVLLVGTAIAAGGAILLAVPKPLRLVAISAYLLFHFGGIFMAVTSPHTHNYPAPMVTMQLYTRVYHPYLQFIYMRNAYHFYSPEPGPASVLVFLLRTDTGQRVQAIDPQTGNPYERKIYKDQWIVMPRRPDDVRDPLGLSYYRRLSLTEQLARGSPGVIVPEIFEKSEVQARRLSRLSLIPLHPTEPIGLQYRLPNSDVMRYLLPSYASHVILYHTPDAETAARTTVKIYRLEHRTLRVETFAARQPDGSYPSPFHPTTYLPFFMGEFDARGELIHPQDELLNWLVPVMPREPRPNDPDDPFRKTYLDYMSVHALELTPQEVLKADEAEGVVFNWSLLR